MTRINKKKYKLSEETKRQENFYHLKKAFRALNSTEEYTIEEAFEKIFNNGN